MGAAGLALALWGLLAATPLVSAFDGILHAMKTGDPTLKKDYCIQYNPNWTTLPHNTTKTPPVKLVFLTSKMLCVDSDVTREIVEGKALVVKRGNCTFLEKGEIAQKLGAKMLLIASETAIDTPYGDKPQRITIPIVLIKNDDIIDLKHVVGMDVNVVLYSPPASPLDTSVAIIFIIAVCCVILGGYWSGMSELEHLKTASNSGNSPSLTSEENVTITPVTAIFFVASCCGMLVLMYFFYRWLVYFIIGIFCMASAMSLFNCLYAIVRRIPYGQCRFPCFQGAIQVRLFFLAVFCLSVSIVWAVFRNENSWSWILQDILGIGFCVNFIKTIKMPNFKACVILLSLLLVYDVFFVFITPYLTKSGESIMVEVAAGPVDSNEKSDGNLLEASAEQSAPHEKLPVVIRVPRLELTARTVCAFPFSLLGFGDIVIPGLLIAYCHRFDVQMGTPSVYFISCTIGYACGMIATFAGLALMKMAQPALLYLVPFTLMTCTLVALYRKELKKFWNGNGYEVMDPMDSAAHERPNEQHE